MSGTATTEERDGATGPRTRRLRLHALVEHLWQEPAFEKHRRHSRLLLLGPTGGLTGLVVGAWTVDEVGVPGVVWLPLTTMGGFAIMYVVAHLETLLRLRGRAEHGRRAMVAEVAMDAFGGGILGAIAARVVGLDAATALAGGASIVAFASWMRRLFLGDWIGDAVRLMSADLRTVQGPDYAEEHRLIAQGDIDGAVALFERRSAEMGGNPAPLVDAAQMLRDRGRYAESIECYRKAMDAPNLEPRRASIFAKQIWEICRRQLLDPQRAIPHLENLVARFPDASESEWAWRELTVGMVVTQAADQDYLGAVGTHVPAVKTVERILSEAFVSHASDIHLEDYAGGLRVRYRIDGVLQDADAPPNRLRAAILARVRVMAGLNPAESPIPQDGRIRVPFAGRDVDIRVSTVPTLHGESVALRVLDSGAGGFELDDLGLLPNDFERLWKVVDRPNGMVLTTGPGGSGKSTTLHAILRKLSTGREKIFTVEDPVEYGIDGVCQVSVNEKAGLTFAKLLRSLVRQDPDVLLVGEIRDTETAQIATHAALTGHLVLSTLHTIDAVSALHRLVDIGVADYLVVHTLEASVAQRLVRRVCPHCAEPRPPTAEEALALAADNGQLETVTTGRGCDRCRGTGYKGRIGLFELCVMNDELRQAFLQRRGQRELDALARANGMWTLREDGLEKIRRGITTPSEVVQATRGP